MFTRIFCYLLLGITSFASLGFENEYKNNRTLYEEMIAQNLNSEYINNNILIKVKIVDYLNVIVNKSLNDIYSNNDYMLKKIIQVKGSGAKDTALKIKEDKYKRIIAVCDNSKW